jgi:hypothetical protein
MSMNHGELPHIEFDGGPVTVVSTPRIVAFGVLSVTMLFVLLGLYAGI